MVDKYLRELKLPCLMALEILLPSLQNPASLCCFELFPSSLYTYSHPTKI